MKKITLSTISFLLIALGCSENTPNPTLYVTILENGGIPASGASIELYSTLQQWLSGQAPVLKATADVNGVLKSTQQLSGDLYLYAERGTKNNWPLILGSGPLTRGSDGVYTGGTGIAESLLADIKSVSTKNYLLTDVKNSGGVSIFASVAACSKDNFIKLGLDQKMILSEGSNVCGGQSPQLVIDYSTISSKDLQTTHSNLTVYPMSVSGQNFFMYVTTDFAKIILFDTGSGVDAFYTKQ